MTDKAECQARLAAAIQKTEQAARLLREALVRSQCASERFVAQLNARVRP